MKEQLVNWIWNYSKAATSKDVLVLLALAQYSTPAGESTVKLAELARMTRLGHEDIRRALRAAVGFKELAIIQNVSADGTRLTNTYRFLLFHRPVEANGEIQFGEPETLPGMPVPKVPDLPPKPKLMMDALQLDMIASDPVYKGLDVRGQAWKFKRWCRAQSPPAQETVKRFKVWLSRV
jgi:hypothetical protein